VARLVLIPLILLASGCATAYIDKTRFGGRIEGWPRLAVVEHHVSDREMVATCASTLPLGVEPAGCAWVDLERRICHLYLGEAVPMHATVRAHELNHCDGRDHIGETALHDLWLRWRARNAAIARSPH
jgi:hypothetical protein